MTYFIYNLLLALVWALLSDTLTLGNLLLGFAVGFFVLRLMQTWLGAPNSYFRKLPQALSFLLFFLKELLLASLRVAHDVITPTLHMRPGIIALPVDARTDLELTLLANLISLTPGTLTLDTGPDRRTLYIHAMFIDDRDALIHEIKDGLERRLLELLR